MATQQAETASMETDPDNSSPNAIDVCGDGSILKTIHKEGQGYDFLTFHFIFIFHLSLIFLFFFYG